MKKKICLPNKPYFLLPYWLARVKAEVMLIVAIHVWLDGSCGWLACFLTGWWHWLLGRLRQYRRWEPIKIIMKIEVLKFWWSWFCFIYSPESVYCIHYFLDFTLNNTLNPLNLLLTLFPAVIGLNSSQMFATFSGKNLGLDPSPVPCAVWRIW